MVSFFEVFKFFFDFEEVLYEDFDEISSNIVVEEDIDFNEIDDDVIDEGLMMSVVEVLSLEVVEFLIDVGEFLCGKIS